MKRTCIPLIVISIALMFASSCASVSPLRYKVYDSPGMLDWALNFDGNQTVQFEPNGMAKAGERLFLFGSLTTPAVTVRSFVIMSENGGKKWQEVAHPVEGSEIITVRFVDDLHGFALVGWVTEGPGDLHVQRTLDGGLTWERMQVIPKDNYSGWPVAFDFTNAKEGRLVLQYMDDNPEELRPVLTSKDGGRTWEAFHDKAVGNGEGLQIENAYSLKLKEGELTLSETEGAWILNSKGAAEPRFVFPKDVPLAQVVAVEVEDCGCPGGDKSKGMLK